MAAALAAGLTAGSTVRVQGLTGDSVPASGCRIVQVGQCQLSGALGRLLPVQQVDHGVTLANPTEHHVGRTGCAAGDASHSQMFDLLFFRLTFLVPVEQCWIIHDSSWRVLFR